MIKKTCSVHRRKGKKKTKHIFFTNATYDKLLVEFKVMTKQSAVYEIFLTILWIISVYKSWICKHLLIIFRREKRKEYLDVERLAQSIRECEPAVVPEFKSLTVGGVLSGAGLESSSFRYGQFGDLLIEATYILSNGQIIICSPTENSDLFYGALNSCNITFN